MQSQSARLAADARLQPFAGRAGFLFGGLAALTALSFVIVLIAATFIVTMREGATATSIDFRVYWSAGKLALAGEPLATFDTARLSAVHNTYIERPLPWLYPPGFLVVVIPFGALSFAAAYALWTILSLGLVAWSTRPFVGGIMPLWLAVSLAPAFLPAVMLGQNSLLLFACLLAALAALRSQRWVLAGIFIGLLTLKPQLGIMIPFALLAVRAWATIGAAIVTTIVLALLPTLAFGVDYWPLLQSAMADHGATVLAWIHGMKWMISLVSWLTLLGVPPAIALSVQLVVTALCAGAVYMLWRSEQVEFDVKAAGLLIAIMLSAPYLWSYEGGLMAAIALFLLRGGVLSTGPLHLVLLGLLWVGAGLQPLNIFFKVVDTRWLGPAFIPVLLLLCLALCLRQVWASRHHELRAT